MELIEGLAFTRVVVLAELLAAFGSGVVPKTVTESVITPATVGLQVMFMEAVAPTLSAPMLQLTMFPFRVQTPMLVWTEILLTLGGRVFVTFTPNAADGPRFVTTTK